MNLDNEAISPGEDDNDDLIKEIKNNLREGRIHISKWREQAREDYDFFAGRQWSSEDSQKLIEENRPPVTFNRVPRTINAVCGLELNNRQEVRYLPRNLGNTGVNEVLSGASKWVRDNCDAEDEESEAFQDSVLCGMGWTETRMDYEEDENGKIVIERVDPLEMAYDPSAKKRNLSDRRWCARVKELSKKEFKQMFPNYDGSKTSSFWNDLEAQPHDATDAWEYRNDQSDKLDKPKYFSVIQYQWYEKIFVYKVNSPEGNISEFSEERFGAIKDGVEEAGLKYVKLPKRKYRQAFLIGDELLDQQELGCDHFTFNCITGLRDRNTNTWFGLVRLMADPQRWANKWLSQILHIVNTSAKSGISVEEDAVSNQRKLEEDWAKPGSISVFRPGALSGGKVQQKEAPRYPEGIDRLLQYAVQSIQDVVGVSLEMLGMTNRDQPGYLEEMRKNSSISLLATFFSTLRYYRKQQGRVLAQYITNYISDGRLVRIVGESGARYIPLLKDHLTFEYDVIVDDAPTSPNMKERMFSVLNQIIPMALQAGIPVPPDVLDYSPLPEELVTKWKQMIKASQSDPINQQMRQLQVMLSELEGEYKKSQTALNYARAGESQAKGQNEAAMAGAELTNIQHSGALAEYEAMSEQHRKNVELDRGHELAVQQVSSDQHRKNIESVHDRARNDVKMLLEQRRKVLESQANASIKARQVLTP